MTKKDFIELANALRQIKNKNDRINMANLIGILCERSNENFNWDIWKEACRV
jgi:hypothetical protein